MKVARRLALAMIIGIALALNVDELRAAVTELVGERWKRGP